MPNRINSLERRKRLILTLLEGLVDGLGVALAATLIVFFRMDDPGADKLFQPDPMNLARLVGVGVVATFGGALFRLLRSKTTSSLWKILLGAGAGLAAGFLFVFSFLTPEAIWQRGAFGMVIGGGLIGATMAAQIEWHRRRAHK